MRRFDFAGAFSAFDPFGRAKRIPLSSKVSRIAAMRKLSVASSSPSPPE